MDFVARKVSAQSQRHQGECRGKGSHQNRVQTVGRTADDALHGAQTLGAEVVVAGNEEHAVACGDAEERDEADDGGNADDASRKAYGQHAADEGKGKVEEHHH